MARLFIDKRRFLVLLLFLFEIQWSSSVFGTSYYFSSVRGSDDNTGTSSSAPWKSMDKLKAIIPSLRPGDRVLLERGSVWENVSLNISSLSGSQASPIVFTAYGTGASPAIKGSRTISSFTANGNLWSTTDITFPDTTAGMKMPAGLYVDNRMVMPGRMPNEGYYSTQTTDTKKTLYQSDGSWSYNQWQGGQLVARTESWTWDRSNILENNGQRFDLEGLHYQLHYTKTYFFIQNHLNALDQDFEWCYRNKTLSVYYSGNLLNRKVEFPVVGIILNLEKCNYLEFNGINFSTSNVNGIKLKTGSGITITNCHFNRFGNAAILSDNIDNLLISNCIVEDCYANGIMLDFPKDTRIENNFFRRTSIQEGMYNGTGHWGASISCQYAYEPVYMQYNRFDSVMIAYYGHYNQSTVYFRYNLIDHYGMQLGDIGAVYLGGESNNSYPKYIVKNIILNGQTSLGSIETRGPNAYSHGIYLDYDCSNVVADSNLIYNTNLAFLLNRVDDNFIRNNTIFRSAVNLLSEWKSAICLDNTTYVVLDYFDRNRIENNLVVIDDNATEVGMLLHNIEKRDNYIDHNTYMLPFRNDYNMIRTYDDSYNFKGYTLQEWSSLTGLESGSSYGNESIKYASSLGIDKKDFVKCFYNASGYTRYIPLDAVYKDIHGTVREDSVQIAPYSSAILFYSAKKVITTNHAPVIANQSFIVNEALHSGAFIGKIIATDPDAGQVLTYSLVAGNTGSIFQLDPAGNLNFSDPARDFLTNQSFDLTVEVSDNGSPVLKRNAIVSVNVIVENHPPDLADQHFSVIGTYPQSLYVCKLSATESDPGQTLTYSILAGDPEGTFSLNASTGELYFSSEEFLITRFATYNLTIQVKDNGTPGLSDQAALILNLVPPEKIIYIDPFYSGPEEDGTLESPYNSWNDLIFNSGYSYLQKRGSSTNIENLNISADNISIGSYGNGTPPVIRFNSQDFAIRSFNARNLTLSNVHFMAENALGCVYLFGTSTNYVVIENCRFEGSEKGIIINDGYNVLIQNCSFSSHEQGIFTNALNTLLYYNLFIHNHEGVSSTRPEGILRICNNLFYDNRIGIISKSNDLLIANNIFCLNNGGDVAYDCSSASLYANNNIHYPEQEGFIRLNSKAYNTMEGLQADRGLELNSIVQNPGLANADNYNFELLPSSPAIDAGQNVGLTADFRGLVVPMGNAPDIGLLESQYATGIPDGAAVQSHRLEIFPNPTRGDVSFQLPAYIVSPSLLEIRDLTGSVVFTYPIDNTGSEKTGLCTVAVNINPGCYIISLRSGSLLYQNKLIVF